MNKKILLPFIALAVLAFGTLGANTFALAQEDVSPDINLVEKISTKFGLDKNEVQKVFDEQRNEMHKEMQARQEERLSQLVKDGKITEAQKTLIVNKQKEMQAQRETNKDSFKDLTPEERKTQMETKKAEIDAWAKENGIDPTYLFPGKGMKDGHGPRARM